MLDMDGTLLDLAFDNYMWKELVPRRYAAENGMPYEEARELLMAKYEAIEGDLAAQIGADAYTSLIHSLKTIVELQGGEIQQQP